MAKSDFFFINIFNVKMKKYNLVIFFSMSLLINIFAQRQHLPSDVLAQLNRYNVSWNTPSVSGSLECMPLGNGDITANVWVEKDGDLLMYIGKSDTWSAGTRLLKVGRVRINISPNPFTENARYTKVLNLHKGEIDITAGDRNNEVKIKVWIDANHPVIRVEATSNRQISINSATELLRPEPFTLPRGNHSLTQSFRGFENGPVRPSESADVLVSNPNHVQWYHRNETSLYSAILHYQNVPELAEKYPDPYIHRTFGAIMKGSDMTAKNDSVLSSVRPGRRFNISIFCYTAQTPTIAEWDQQIKSVVARTETQSLENARRAHHQWWDEFWNRSWIFLSGDEEAEKITQGYLLQRFMMACQSRGQFPAKFNGGNLTFDYRGNNGDYRRWGPGYWFQNNRLFYWPLIASGDLDLLKPWFKMYMDMLPIQTDITKKYYGHGGAFFPETANFFGLYIQDDWGWNNIDGGYSENRWIRHHYSGTLEFLAMMLDYYAHTKDEEFVRQNIIPYAEQTIRFYDIHWSRINGTIRFVPAAALEQFWDCVNPVDYMAGLIYTIGKLKALPEHLAPRELISEWDNLVKSLPPIPMDRQRTRILPAEEYGQPRNFENPECYVIFPFKLYGLGMDNLEVALNTFNERRFNQSTCWSQCVIQAPLLGLSDFTREALLHKVNSVEPNIRFPAFWRPGSDYIPYLDNGGSMSIGLQNMLLQNVNEQILVLPALPEMWSVDFKLHAHDNTTVRVRSRGKDIVAMDVFPESRRANVKINVD